MDNGEQSGSGGQRDWRIVLAQMIGAAVVAGVGLSLQDRIHLGLWLGMIAFALALGVGALLGQLVGSLVFRRPPGNGPRA